MIDTLNSWADPWTAFMLRGLLDTAIVLTVVTLLWLAVRHRTSAQLGYGLFGLVLLKLVVPLPVSVPAWLAGLSPAHVAQRVAARALDAPEVNVPAEPQGASVAGPIHFEEASGLGRTTGVHAVAAPGPVENVPNASREAATTPAAEPGPGPSWRACLMLAWAAVVVGLLARFGWVQWATHRLIRAAIPLDPETFPADLDGLCRLAGLRRRVPVLGSADCASPAVGGLLRPRLLVPLDMADTLPPGPLAWVLLHELAHIRRGDLWVALVQRLLQMVYFFNPFVWLASRAMDRQREYACDDAALALSRASRRDCGAGFLSVVERVHASPAPVPLALGLFHNPTFLRRRLMRILDKDRPVRARLSAGAAALLVALAALVLPTMHAQSPKPAAEPSDAAAGPVLVHLRGRVLGPDGRPVAGASLYVKPAPDQDCPVGATTGADGRFDVELKRDALVHPVSKHLPGTVTVVATGRGCGPDAADISTTQREQDVTLHLVRDDLPVRGRFLDLQGKPVAGVKVSVRSIRPVPAKEWDRFIEFVKEGKPPYQFPGIGRGVWGRLPGQPPAVTDRDGRFRLTGVGRDRVVELGFQGDGIESSWLSVMTHPGETITSPPHGRAPMPPLYAATFEHVVRPDRPIIGTVRDKRTGKPVAGIQVFGHGGAARAVTDERGRYELRGCPKSPSYGVVAFPAHGEPYFNQSVRVADTPGLGPITADLEMVRGIAFRGKVIDRATGKGVAAEAAYYPLYPNPNVRDVPGYGAGGGLGPHSEATAGQDGSFRCVVLPGPGFVAVRLPTELARHYRSAAVDVKAFFKKQPNSIALPFDNNDVLLMAVESGGASAMAPMPQAQFQAVVLLNPAKDAKPITQDIYLEPARAVRGTILDPDGKPLTGVRVRGLDADDNWSPALKTADFSIRGLNPRRPRRLYFQHDDKALAATVVVRGDEKEALTVRMQRAATVTGRLVNADGLPVAHAQLYSGGPKKPNDPTFGQLPENFQTDAQGRFRIRTFLPGLKYNLIWAEQKSNPKAGYVFEELSFGPGETRDLGAVQVKPFKYE